jgi:hypothetical protein
MGFNWATYFAQSATLFRLESSLEASGSHRLYDRGPSWRWAPGTNQSAHYSYIDNLGLLNDSKEKLSQQLIDTQKHFDDLGLKLHEAEFGGGGGEALGIYSDGRRRVTREIL